jgi:thiamine-phosphate diphosphorylase
MRARGVSSAALTLVTDRRRLPGQNLAGIVRAAALAGIDFVQLREKDLDGGALLALARELLAVVAGTGTRVLVNTRLDVAVAAGAWGVQLPEEGLPTAAVRSAYPALVVGASCHSLEAALRAEGEGASFVVLGPIFPTPGKEARALGLDVLERVAGRLAIPVHAIGGMDATTVRLAVAAGAAGVAAIRPFLDTPAAEAVGALRRSMRPA